MEPDPLAVAPGGIMPARQQRQMFLLFGQGGATGGMEATISRSRASSDTFDVSANATAPATIPGRRTTTARYRARSRRDRDAVQPVDVAHQIVALRQHLLDALQALVLPRGFFEIHLLAQPVARGGVTLHQSRAVARQKFLHAINFAPILFAAHRLLARPQAHVHLAVNAAGMLRARLQIFLAAPDLEKVQELILEQLRRARVRKGP